MAVTGMEDTVEATMVATEDTTTARGPLMLRLRLMLSPPPPLSPDMVTTAMDMDTALTDTAMLLLTPTDIMVTTARGPLMLSPDMATDTATDTDTEDTEDTTTERSADAEPGYGYYGHGYGGYRGGSHGYGHGYGYGYYG